MTASSSPPPWVLPATHIGRCAAYCARSAVAARGDVGGQLEVELEVAGDLKTCRIRAQGAKALGILGPLRRNDRRLRERPGEQRPQALVAADRTAGDACARDHQRHAPPRAFAVQVRPQLGFEDHGQARLHPVKEAPHGARQVERQVAHLGDVTEECTGARHPGRGEAGDGQWQLRMAPVQRVDQGRTGLHLAHGHRVQPGTARRRPRSEPETLAEMLPVAAVPEPAPQVNQGDDRGGKIDGEEIEDAQESASA